jgi:glutathione peroxidase
MRQPFAARFALLAPLALALAAAAAPPPGAGAGSARSAARAAPALPATAWDVTMTAINGRPMPFSQYRGRVLLVVNTASMCGFTPQYEGLQKLADSFGPRGLTIIGVPSGDFAGQEYGSNAEIKDFCETRFGIRFPMTEKSVVTGPQAAPFYRWAASRLGAAKTPQWNFHKYLVGRDGQLIDAFGSRVAPQSPQLTAAIEAALAGKAG